jgi:hypothetical protein
MLSPTPVRRCPQCGLEKLQTTEFFARKLGGWQSACKLCFNARQRERRLANSDELKQQRREYASPIWRGFASTTGGTSKRMTLHGGLSGARRNIERPRPPMHAAGDDNRRRLGSGRT